MICDTAALSWMSSADASPFFTFTVAGLAMSTVTLVAALMLMVRTAVPVVSVSGDSTKPVAAPVLIVTLPSTPVLVPPFAPA